MAPRAARSGPSNPSDELQEGYRFIGEEDADAPFHCDHPLMGQYTMRDFLAMSREPDTEVILRDVDGRPGVVAVAYLQGDVYFVEKVARDGDCPNGYGLPMLMVLERRARALGKRELRLEAINDELAARYEALGFERNGQPYVDGEEPKWGTLLPMRKLLR